MHTLELEPLLREVSCCPLCSGHQRVEMFRDPPFQVLKCQQCQLVYTSPQLPEEALPLVYTEPYWTSPAPKTRGYADYRQEEPHYLKTFRGRYSLLEPHICPPGRALDIGCAAGYFLQVLAENGWEACGVEISSAITRGLDSSFPIHLGPLETAPWAAGSFDLVSLWDVIEHVRDPVGFLEQAVRLLRPDGILILETQNVESWFARLLGPRWHHYKHWEHLVHFSPATLERLTTGVGLQTLTRTTRFAGKFISFGFLRERAGRLSPWLSSALRLLAWLDPLHFYANPRDEMIVIARNGDRQTLPNC